MPNKTVAQVGSTQVQPLHPARNLPNSRLLVCQQQVALTLNGFSSAFRKMKLPQLTTILDDWNQEWFKAIEGAVGGKWAEVPGSSPEDAVRSVQLPSGTCYCGEFKDHQLFPVELTVAGDAIAVGSVLDNQSYEEADLPVVVAVGVNYWQFGKLPRFAMQAGWRKTGMRVKLDSAMNRLFEIGCWTSPPPNNYHLVAANFFPWVTRTAWSKIPNSLTEALAFHCWGLPDAPKLIANLVDQMDPETILAFHGVNNAVPLLGIRTIHSLTSTPRILFTNNLGYSTLPTNVATVKAKAPSRPEVARVMDE